MKVVLIKDVRNMGRSGEVLDVADGHATNFLLPRKLAIQATAQAIQHAELHQKQHADRKAMDAGLLAQNIATLNDKKVTVAMKANDKGHLYEAVAAAEVVAAAKAQANVDLPEDVIVIEKPIKEVGSYEVSIVSGDNSGKFTIEVTAAE